MRRAPNTEVAFIPRQRFSRRLTPHDRHEEPMSDAPALRVSPPPGASRALPHPHGADADDSAALRGLLNATLLSVPIWVLIGMLVAALI
jgi:hypothetical protein